MCWFCFIISVRYKFHTLYPTPYTLYYSPHTLYSTPCTLYPIPCALEPGLETPPWSVEMTASAAVASSHLMKEKPMFCPPRLGSRSPDTPRV